MTATYALISVGFVLVAIAAAVLLARRAGRQPASTPASSPHRCARSCARMRRQPSRDWGSSSVRASSSGPEALPAGVVVATISR